MKLYHVLVEQDEGWYVGRVLERDGVTTQGRSIDELIFMVRDAVELMWDEKNVALELVVPGNISTSFKLKPMARVKRRPRARAAMGKRVA